MIDYKLKTITDDIMLLVREKENIPRIQGLPPISSQCIIMEPDELDLLLKVVKDYADQRRNTNV